MAESAPNGDTPCAVKGGHLYGPLWPFMALYGPQWPALYGPLWPTVAGIRARARGRPKGRPPRARALYGPWPYIGPMAHSGQASCQATPFSVRTLFLAQPGPDLAIFGPGTEKFSKFFEKKFFA